MHSRPQPQSQALISQRNGEPTKVLVFGPILANPVDKLQRWLNSPTA
jgi:hypothetical protein